MYLTRKEIELKIWESFDDVVFHNGRRLDEILPVNERMLIVGHILDHLPDPMTDIIKKYHKDRKLEENVDVKDVYYHLLEEVIEVGIELGIRHDAIYTKFMGRLSTIISKTQLLHKRNYNTPYIPTKENLLKELADVSIIVASLAKYVNMLDILYEAILAVRDSNDSKILNSIEEVKTTVKEKNLSGNNIQTKELGNNKYIILDLETGKTIKPIGYKEPDLKHLFK